MLRSRKYRAIAARSTERVREERTNRIVELIAIVIAAVVFGQLFLAPLEAYGASLPYVDDCTERVDGKYNVTVTAAGKDCKLRVVDVKSKKRVKVRRYGRNVWLVKLRPHRSYKLQVRDSGRWQTIRYRIG